MLLDESNNIVIASRTNSNSKTPNIVFIPKLTADLTDVMTSSTLIGNGFSVAISLDNDDFVFVGGTTRSPASLTTRVYDTTYNGNLDSFNNGQDVFVSKFENSTFFK